jgi:hypothetical protein
MWRRTLALLAAVLAIPLAFELGFAVAVETGWVRTPRPNRGGSGFWKSQHPVFGVWHAPDTVRQHTSRCFGVEYRTNSIGARDVERSRRATRPRVVVLGDSFLEGWGVDESQRLSNRLESATGVEHLNFAMAHFGPYQAYLAYRELARHFDHNAVIVSVVPTSDFRDIDYEAARELGWYEFRYRPYLVGEAPAYEHFDHREPGWRHWLRRYSYAFNALRQVLRNRALRASAPPPSRFYDFSQREYRRLEAILERLVGAAEGRPILVLLIPTAADLRRYLESGQSDPLSARMAAFAARHEVQLLNLLPPMAADLRRSQGYFHACDTHWNALGNALATEVLLSRLGSDFGPFARVYADDRPDPTVVAD